MTAEVNATSTVKAILKAFRTAITTSNETTIEKASSTTTTETATVSVVVVQCQPF